MHGKIERAELLSVSQGSFKSDKGEQIDYHKIMFLLGDKKEGFQAVDFSCTKEVFDVATKLDPRTMVSAGVFFKTKLPPKITSVVPVK